MARKLRLQYEGAIYHITARGNGRRRIFRNDDDRQRFLWRLAESCELYDVRIYLVCLMDNHLHLVAETPRGNLSRFMQSVLTGYTVYFNLRHETCGHVMQGRYGAKLVEGNEYLLRLSRYVHLNPVRGSTHKNLSVKEKGSLLNAYCWSTYRGYIDKRERWDFVEYEPTLSLLPGSKKGREEEYRYFVETGIVGSEEELTEMMNGLEHVGSKEFRRWADEECKSRKSASMREEDISFREEAEFIDEERVLRAVASSFKMDPIELKQRQYGCKARPLAARMLCRHAGMNQRGAAEVLGYGTGAAVSIQLKKLQVALATDKKLARQLDRIEKELTKVNI
jgi:putative transposase